MLSLTRSLCFAAGMLLLPAMLSLDVQAQESVPTGPSRPGAGRTAIPNKYLFIPGMDPLSLESVQQEIRLTADQRRQLKQLSDTFVNEMQEQQGRFHREMEALRDRPEEQDKKGAAMEQQMGQLAQATHRKAETILSRDQLAAIHEISFRLFVVRSLSDPASEQHLGLDAQQQQQLMSIYEQSSEQLHKVQRLTAAQLLKTLTPEQQAKLREDMDHPPRRQ